MIEGLRQKISFRSLPEVDVLILDASGAQWITQLILSDQITRYFVLPARKERYFFSPTVLLHFIPRLFMGLLLKILKRFGFFKLNHDGLMDAYFLAVIKAVRPKVVVTFIDTSLSFSRLVASHLPCVFIAIQNGNRWHIIKDGLPPVHLQHFFCYGDLEVERFSVAGHRIEHFYPVGSILGDYARRKYSEQTAQVFDVCLISQWRDSIMLGGQDPHIKIACETLTDFLAQYIKEENIRVCVACSGKSQAELDYFKRSLGPAAVVVENERSEFTSYRLMLQSDLTVSFFSTSAVEALGWGKKVLFCNYSGKPILSFPVAGPWVTAATDYMAFKSAMKNLQKMSTEEFRTMSNIARRETMAYPNGDKANYELIRAAIARALIDYPESIGQRLHI